MAERSVADALGQLQAQTKYHYEDVDDMPDNIKK